MKLHYPPKAEDATNIIDRIFDKAVEATRPIRDLASGLKSCAEQLQNLALTVAIIAQNQALHHRVIQRMYDMQQLIYQRLEERSLDTSMPDLEPKIDPKDEAALSAAEVKKKAASKPN